MKTKPRSRTPPIEYPPKSGVPKTRPLPSAAPKLAPVVSTPVTPIPSSSQTMWDLGPPEKSPPERREKNKIGRATASARSAVTGVPKPSSSSDLSQEVPLKKPVPKPSSIRIVESGAYKLPPPYQGLWYDSNTESSLAGKPPPAN